MSNDRRENFRFTLQPDQRRAKVKVNGKKFSAEIIEQSCAGFRVQLPIEANVALDDVVTLDYWSGTCQAVVAYVEDVNKTRRLGLKRISDDVPTRMGWLKSFWCEQQPSKHAKRGSGRPGLVAAGCLALTLLLAGGLALRSRQDSPAIDNPAAASLAKQEAAAEANPDLASEREANSGDKASPLPSAPAAQPPARPEPMAILQRLLVLQSAEKAAELELSEQQKLEISRLLEETSRGLGRLQSRRAAKSQAERKEKVRALFSRTEARAQNILTPQQRAKWLGELSAQQQAEVQATAMADSASDN